MAIRSLVDANPDALLKDLGLDNKKVTFEVERFLGKPLKKHKSEDTAADLKRTNSRQKQPPVVTENPFATELPEMTQ